MADGETTLYLHDLDGNVISEVDGSGTVRRDYVWVEHRGTSSAAQAPGTALPLVQVTGLDTPGQEIAWIHTDHQNRQVILTNATGGLVRTVVTTPFGMLARDSGQTVHQTSAGFAGQWKLPEAGTNGLQYNWHRHYDPTLGRYTQPDPLGLIDGPSRYGYALQNPVAFEDPRGELVPALIFACLSNPLCRSGAGGVIGAGVAYLIDDDECFTWQEAANGFFIGAGLAAPHYWFNPGKNVRGGGIRLWKNGPGLEWHKFGLGPKGNKRIVNRPHYHRGRTKSQLKKHRPWEGKW